MNRAGCARLSLGAASEIILPARRRFPPFRGCVAPSAGLRLLLRIVLRLAVPKVRKTEAVAVLRFREREDGAGV